MVKGGLTMVNEGSNYGERDHTMVNETKLCRTRPNSGEWG